MMSILGIISNLALSWFLLVRQHQRRLRQSLLLLLGGFFIYGMECYNGITLLTAAHTGGAFEFVAFIVIATYGLALVRAWELLGARRYSLFGWIEMLLVRDGDETNLTE